MAQQNEQSKNKSNPEADSAPTAGTRAQQDREHVAEQLPEEEIGNVTAGFSEEPDRDEEGQCKEKDLGAKEKDNNAGGR